MKLLQLLNEIFLPVERAKKVLHKYRIAYIALKSPLENIKSFVKKYNNKNFYLLTDYYVHINEDALLIATPFSYEKVKYILEPYKDIRAIVVEDYRDLMDLRNDALGEHKINGLSKIKGTILDETETTF